MRIPGSMPLALGAALLVALAGCGGTDDGTTEDSDTGSGDAQSSDQSSNSGTATITFEDGEVLSTDVLCTLEPQVSADQEILYTATSLSNPYFDLTAWGDEAVASGTTVSWDETEDFETYQVSWAAGWPASDFESSLDGNTMVGSGAFTRGDDATGPAGETRNAEVEVVCGG